MKRWIRSRPRRRRARLVAILGDEQYQGLDTITSSTPNLRASADRYYGTMEFTLAPGGYRWDYASALESSTPAPAGTAPSYSDTGSQRCHGDGGEH